MARIKIVDLPKDMKVSREEMKKVLGGAIARQAPSYQAPSYQAPSYNASYLAVATVPSFVPQ